MRIEILECAVLNIENLKNAVFIIEKFKNALDEEVSFHRQKQ